MDEFTLMRFAATRIAMLQPATGRTAFAYGVAGLSGFALVTITGTAYATTSWTRGAATGAS